MGELDGRVALVTGAAGGIGRAVAERFAAEGARLTLTDIQEEPLAELVAQLERKGCEAIGLRHDAASEDDWAEVMRATAARFGTLDILVNNAGLGVGTELLTTTLAEWRAVTSVNLDGVFLGCQHGVRAMLGDGETPRRIAGAIVNLSSVYGLKGRAGLGAYCASKGGVRLLTKAVALEAAEGEWNIRVNSVHPGFVRTAMGDVAATRAEARLKIDSGYDALAALHPVGRVAEAKEIADAILFAASDRSSFMTGAELVVDGGMSAD